MDGASGSAAALSPQNLVELLLERGRNASSEAVGFFQGDRQELKTLSWAEVIEQVQTLSEGLVELGVKPGDRVAIFGATRLTWMLCDLAVSAAGGVTVPIYASSTADEIRYILQDAEAVFLLVDDDRGDARQSGRLTRAREARAGCATLKGLVLFEGEPSGDSEWTLESVHQKGVAGRAARPGAFAQRVGAIRADHLSTLIYTSGTTGRPKGVMQTHGGWAYQARAMERIRLMLPSDAVILFLPFAHVFGQLIKSAWVSTGFRLIFAQGQDTLLADMARSGPTVLPTVPRLIEKLYRAVVAGGMAAPGARGRLFRWAMRHFEAYVEARKAGRPYRSLGFTLARALVFKKAGQALRHKLGGELARLVTGGAPLSPTIGWMMELLGFVVVEGYGLTESTAVAAINPPDPPGRAKIGTVGLPLPGTEIRLRPDGEVELRGPSVMKGYFHQPAATAEVLGSDGWLRSGDLGELDADGYLRITDRKKDILVTAGGKNVAPQPIENQLRAHPLISQALVLGDRRPYLTALLTVNEEAARKLLAERKGGEPGSYAELVQRPEVRDQVQRAVDEVNAGKPPHLTLKAYALLDHDLAQEGGELTPTLKVKRSFCAQKYRALLDGLYAEALVD